MRLTSILAISVMLCACSAEAVPSDSTSAGASANAAAAAPDAMPNAAAAGATEDRPRAITAASSPGRTTCTNIIGRLWDDAPEGRNVRAGPSASTARLGVLPPPLTEDRVPNLERLLPVEFNIIGSENGWLRIRNARYDEDLAGAPVPAVFSDEGWISGRGVGVIVQTQLGFAEPSHDSAVLIDGRPHANLDGWRQRGIAGCTGQWVLVDWQEPAAPFEGQEPARWLDQAIVSRAPFTLRAWSAGVCNILETTCEGTDGDTPEHAFRDD